MELVYKELQEQHVEHLHSKVSNIATISSGIAIFDNDNSYDLETSLTLCDAALYEAKQGGRNRYILHTY